jgi:hypothetical protein
LYLSNEAHLVPANDTGVVSSYTGASTNAKVYRGATDVTSSEGWTISAPSYTGLSSAPTISAQTVSVTTGMTADVATITVRASRSGQTLDRIFTLSKAKQGTTGPSGVNGTNGTNGTNGIRGSVSAYIQTFSASAAWNAIVSRAGSNPVPGDYVETESGARHAYTSGGDGTTSFGNWTTGQSVAFSGNVIVQDTLTANKLAAGAIGSHRIELGAYNNDPNAIIQSRGFAAGSGWRIDGAGNAEFYNVKVRGDVLLGGGNIIPNSGLTLGTSGLYCVAWSNNSFSVSRGGWGSDTYPYYVTMSGPYAGHLYWVIQGSTTGSTAGVDINNASIGRLRVNPGSTYQLSGYLASYLSDADLGFHQYGISGNYLRYVSAGYLSSWENKTGNGDIDTTFKRVGAQISIPADCFYVTPYVYKNSTTSGSYIRATRLNLVEIPKDYSYLIPWSPGGISLLDTLGMRANAVTVHSGSYESASWTLVTGSPFTSQSTYISLPVAPSAVTFMVSAYIESANGTTFREVLLAIIDKNGNSILPNGLAPAHGFNSSGRNMVTWVYTAKNIAADTAASYSLRLSTSAGTFYVYSATVAAIASLR